MADTLEEMLSDLKKAEEIAKNLNSAQAKELQKILKDMESSQAFKNIAKDTKDAKDSADRFASSLTPIKEAIDAMRGSANMFSAGLGTIATALYNTTNAAMDAGEQFNAAFNKNIFGVAIGGIDEVTKLSREFRGEAIKVGSEFGLGFEEASKTYQTYSGAVLMAQNATYASRQEIENNALSLAKMGISLDEISKTLVVAGENQNLLTEGFRLAQDSGLAESKVFDIMATAARKMGLDIEDANKPILALESLAKTTGLPITELSGRIFGLAEQYSRFGMNVESISPILRRFTNVLGDGFKGLAIDDTLKLVQGLAGQVNTTNAAFMAMQSGMARPGAGVAGAMLDFEDAMAEPEKAMKMLSSSLANISGGKILTIEDARRDEAAATQFKLQRDMLSQLTGINDPQQTRTLMALLSAQQSGKELTSAENKTLSDAMKSGANKQEEQRSLVEKIGKAQVGLLTQIALDISNAATRTLTPQTQSGLIGRSTTILSEYSAEARNKVGGMLDNAMKIADEFLSANMPESAKKAGSAVEKFTETGKEQITRIPTQRISAFNAGEQPLTIGGTTSILPAPTSPRPIFPTASTSPPGAPIPTTSTREVHAPGEKEIQHVVVTFRGTDELTKAIATAATQAYNKTLHGNG